MVNLKLTHLFGEIRKIVQRNLTKEFIYLFGLYWKWLFMVLPKIQWAPTSKVYIERKTSEPPGIRPWVTSHASRASYHSTKVTMMLHFCHSYFGSIVVLLGIKLKKRVRTFLTKLIKKLFQLVPLLPTSSIEIQFENWSIKTIDDKRDTLNWLNQQNLPKLLCTYHPWRIMIKLKNYLRAQLKSYESTRLRFWWWDNKFHCMRNGLVSLIIEKRRLVLCLELSVSHTISLTQCLSAFREF